MSEITDTTAATQSEEGQVHVAHSTGDLPIIPAAYRLNGKNFLKWSQLVRTSIKGRGKLSHFLGTGPKEEDPKFQEWDKEDAVVMSWLWDSMTPEISDTYMLLPTAKEIWDAINQTYSKVRDAAPVYDIKVKTMATKQGSKPVTEYSNLLKNLWHELDHYRVLEMKCSTDAITLKKFIERDRVFEFLAGLNIEFDQVRIQILGKEEVSSLNEVISLVWAEESRRGVMLEPQSIDGSAMVVTSDPNRNLNQNQPNQEHGRDDLSRNHDKDKLWCL